MLKRNKLLIILYKISKRREGRGISWTHFYKSRIFITYEIVYKSYANYTKKDQISRSNMLHIYYSSMILYNDILSTATGVTVKKAIFSREKHDYTPSEGKKINDFLSFIGCCCCYAFSIDEYRADARTEMKSSSISFESWPYDKFVLMTRHVSFSTFPHTHHPVQCWRNSCERSRTVLVGRVSLIVGLEIDRMSYTSYVAGDIWTSVMQIPLTIDSVQLSVQYDTCNHTRRPSIYNQNVKKMSWTG